VQRENKKNRQNLSSTPI